MQIELFQVADYADRREGFRNNGMTTRSTRSKRPKKETTQIVQTN